jgi:protein tyrosine phosphatase
VFHPRENYNNTKEKQVNSFAHCSWKDISGTEIRNINPILNCFKSLF